MADETNYFIHHLIFSGFYNPVYFFFKNDTKKESNLYLSEEQRYQPNKGRVQTNTDYFKGGTVLIHNLYVSGADFKIPSATTNDMLR